MSAVNDTAAVLLGYGVSPPTGHHRRNYLQQVEWVEEALATRDIPVWTFGGRPAHPSRWHRIVHRESPGETVESVIAHHLRRTASYPLRSSKNYGTAPT